MENSLEKVIALLNEAGYQITAPYNTKSWRNKLELTKQKTVKPTNKNFVITFENSPEFSDDTIRWNDFTRCVEYNNEPLNNFLWAKLRNDFENVIGVRNKDVIKDFVFTYAYENMYNPIKEYIENIKWDGKQRLETVFIDWFKVEDTNITRQMSKKWFVSAIKRIYEPGCDVEGMIILTGKQGIGKSTFVKRLSKGYSVDAVFDIKDEKRCAETCNKSWIMNFDELKSFIKSDPETAKSFLTRTADTCRLAYREESETYLRHCVFIGSVNDSSILKDYSGDIERRFWIMKCMQDDKKYIYDNFTDDIVDQIWAEAFKIYSDNKNYNISISDFNEVDTIKFKTMQKQFKTYADDDLVDGLREILDDTYNLCDDGSFRNMNDFKDQLINKDEYKLNGKINRIPFSYINIAINTIFKTNRPNKWIAAALEDEWIDVQRALYGNRKLHCLVRKGSQSLFDLTKE